MNDTDIEAKEIIMSWENSNIVQEKGQDRMNDYNERMKQMGPTTEHHKAMMAKMLNRIAPDRTDINTWFSLMALDDEKTFAL